MSYEQVSRLSKNEWVSDPRIPDPENLPQPLGWCLLVRPYPITTKTKTILVADETINAMNYTCNIGRVVAIGDSCWSRPEHRTFEGEKKRWAEVGDFVSYPKNTGAKRKFKDVSYVLLMDDEIVERLPDPRAFDDGFFQIDIPDEDLQKYNSAFKKVSE